MPRIVDRNPASAPAAQDTAAPPPGFVLDSPSQPAPPPGFQVDSPAPPAGFAIDGPTTATALPPPTVQPPAPPPSMAVNAAMSQARSRASIGRPVTAQPFSADMLVGTTSAGNTYQAPPEPSPGPMSAVGMAATNVAEAYGFGNGTPPPEPITPEQMQAQEQQRQAITGRILADAPKLMAERPDLAQNMQSVNWSEALAQRLARQAHPEIAQPGLDPAYVDSLVDPYREYYGGATSAQQSAQYQQQVNSAMVGKVGHVADVIAQTAGESTMGPFASVMDIAAKGVNALAGTNIPDDTRQQLTQSLAETYATNPDLQDSLLLTQLPAGATSLALFALGGAAGQSTKMGAGAVASLMGSALGMDQGYAEAMAEENPDILKTLALMAGQGVLGATEGIPIGEFFKRVDKATAGKFSKTMLRGLLKNNPVLRKGAIIGREAVVQALEEAAQEYGQEFWGRMLTESVAQDPNFAQAINEAGVQGGQGATVGGILGGVLGGAGVGIGLQSKLNNRQEIRQQNKAYDILTGQNQPAQPIAPQGQQGAAGAAPVPGVQTQAQSLPPQQATAQPQQQPATDDLSLKALADMETDQIQQVAQRNLPPDQVEGKNRIELIAMLSAVDYERKRSSAGQMAQPAPQPAEAVSAPVEAPVSNSQQMAVEPQEGAPGRTDPQNRVRQILSTQYGRDIDAEIVEPTPDNEEANTIRDIAAGLSVKVSFFQSGEDVDATGFVDPSDPGRLYLNAGERGTSMLRQVFAHEWSHSLKRTNPELWNQLADELGMRAKATLEKSGKAYENAAQQIPGYLEVLANNPEQRTEEHVAAAIEDLMADPQAWADLKQRDPGLFQKLVEYVREMVQRIKGAAPDAAARLEQQIAKAQGNAVSAILKAAERNETKLQGDAQIADPMDALVGQQEKPRGDVQPDEAQPDVRAQQNQQEIRPDDQASQQETVRTTEAEAATAQDRTDVRTENTAATDNVDEANPVRPTGVAGDGSGQRVADQREPWEMTRDEWKAAGYPIDNWANVVRRNRDQGKAIPQAVADELNAHDAARKQREKPKPSFAKPEIGDTIVRYTHGDGSGLLNNAGLDRSKLTDDEEAELTQLMDYGLQQPASGTRGTFFFTQEGESRHARMLALLSKASKTGVIRTESKIETEPSWVSFDGQIAVAPRAEDTAQSEGDGLGDGGRRGVEKPKTLREEAKAADTADLEALVNRIEYQRDVRGVKTSNQDKQRLQVAKAELRTRKQNAPNWAEMSDDDWIAGARFYRSGKDRMAELPNGKKAILEQGNTASNFREKSREFLLSTKPRAEASDAGVDDLSKQAETPSETTGTVTKRRQEGESADVSAPTTRQLKGNPNPKTIKKLYETERPIVGDEFVTPSGKHTWTVTSVSPSPPMKSGASTKVEVSHKSGRKIVVYTQADWSAPAAQPDAKGRAATDNAGVYRIGETTYFKGSKVKVTTAPYELYGGEFQDAVTESGKTVTIVTPRQRDAQTKKNQDQYTKQQEAFARLRDPQPTVSAIPINNGKQFRLEGLTDAQAKEVGAKKFKGDWIVPRSKMDMVREKVAVQDKVGEEKANGQRAAGPIPYSKDLKITNMDAMPKGSGARYLEVVRGENDTLIAKQWRRKPVANAVLVDFEAKAEAPAVSETAVKQEQPAPEGRAAKRESLAKQSRKDLLVQMKKAGLKPTAKTTKAQAIEAMATHVPEKPMSKARVQQMVREYMPNAAYANTDVRNAADKSQIGADEATRVEAEADEMAKGVTTPQQDYARLLARVYVLDKKGELHKQDIGKLVGLSAQDLEVGDTFQTDDHTGEIIDKTDNGVTLTLTANTAKFTGAQLESEEFTIPTDALIPANAGSVEVGEQQQGAADDKVSPNAPNDVAPFAAARRGLNESTGKYKDQEIKTGVRVTLPYTHSKFSATDYFGVPDSESPFDRGFEPSGRYLTVADGLGKLNPDEFEAGEITFSNPLVLDVGEYGEPSSWKRLLSKAYEGKTGKALSKAIIADGYDAVVTVSNRGEPSEVLDLTTFDESKARFAAARRGTESGGDQMTFGGLREGATTGRTASLFGGQEETRKPKQQETGQDFDRARDVQKGSKLDEEVKADLDEKQKRLDEDKETGMLFAVKKDDGTDLAVVHNLSERNLRFTDEMGGQLAMPSVAISRSKKPIEGFGEISLIASPDMVDPRKSKATRVSNADQYSPRAPQPSYVLKKGVDKVWKPIEQWAKDTYGGMNSDQMKKEAYGVRSLLYGVQSHLESSGDFLRDGPEVLLRDYGLKAYYASTQLGKTFKNTDSPNVKSELDDLINQNRAAFESWTRNLMDGQYERKLFKGFTYAGNKRYAPFTMDEIMREMRKDLRSGEGEGFFYGAGSVRAKVAKKYTSLSAIQKDRGKLIDKTEMDKLGEQFNNRMFEIAEDGQSAYQYKPEFGFADTFWNAILDARRGGRKVLEEYGFDYDLMPWSDINQFLDDLKEAPSEYFEAKINRAVRLYEFKGAVVPDNVSDDTLAILASNGITEIEKYRKEDQGDRGRAVDALARRIEDTTGKQILFAPARSAGVPDSASDKIKELARKEWVEKGTDSRFFKKWLGRSVVRHPVYHWTEHEFDTFDMSDTEGMHFGTKQAAIDRAGYSLDIEYEVESDDDGHWVFADVGPYSNEGAGPFATEKEARRFISQQPKEQEPLTVYIRLENPVRMPDLGTWGVEEILRHLPDGIATDADQERIMAAEGWDKPREIGESRYDLLREHLLSKGIDGIVYQNEVEDPGSESYIAFSPTQIKSATGNQGTFDESNPDIRFAAAYHGSPYDFDKFDSSKIGTGEGAQAYGWGLYFAGKKEVAEWYKKNLQHRAGDNFDWSSVDLPSELTGVEAEQFYLLREKLARNARGGPAFTPNEATAWRRLKDKHDLRQAAIEAAKPKAGLYEVDLKPAEDEYLLWDKPLSEQSEKVKKALAQNFDFPYRDSQQERWGGHLSGGENGSTGSDLYHALIYDSMWGYEHSKTPEMSASMYLRSLGIRGIKYLDGSSRHRVGGNHFLTKKDGDGKWHSRIKSPTDDAVVEISPPFNTKDEADAWARREIEKDADYNYVIFSDEDIEITARFAAARKKLGRDQEQLFDGFDIASETVRDRLLRRLQDKFLPVKRAQDQIVAQGGKISDQSDTYLAEELFHGRAETRLNKFRDSRVNPIKKIIARSGLTLNEVDEYLYAKHAPERNKRIAEINPELREQGIPGSGMATDEANAIIQKFKDEGKDKSLDAIARIIKRVNTERLDLLESEGLLSADERKAWTAHYQNYVPLRTDMDGESRPRTGKGFDIRGKEGKQALGRRSKADSPLLFSLMQYEESLIRAEKNRVGQRFLKFVQDNPDKNLWEVNKPARKAYLDKKTGLVTYRHDPTYKLADNVLSVKVGGKEQLITIHNEPLAQAMKNLNAEQSGKWLRHLANGMRVLSQLQTGWNPEFVISNFARDLQTAGFNLAADRDFRTAARVLRNAPKALRGAHQAIRNPDADTEWAKYFNEFAEVGGRVGWYHSPSIEERAKDLNRDVAVLNGKPADKVKAAFGNTMQWIDDWNSAIENGVRLSSYVEMRKSGMSKERAASVAKNLTVNFNRKGELGQVMNTLYLFYNASVQGTMRFAQSAIKTKRGRAMALSLIIGSALLDQVNRAISDDDDDGENFYDKIPDYEREHNLIFMVPGSEDGYYLKIPLPYGYNIFHVLGQQTSAAMTGKRTPVEAATNVAGATWGAFSPIGGESTLAQAIAPTIIDPVVQLAENKTFYGAPIMPTQDKYGPEKPDSELYFKSVSPVAKKAASMMNKITGGDEVTKGWVDMSPETLEHLYGFLVGGAGRTIKRAFDTGSRAWKGEPQPLREVPFVRRLIGEPDPRHVGRTFYENRDKLELVEHRIKTYEQSGDHNKAKAVRQKNKAILALRGVMGKYEKRIKKLNDRIDAAADDEKARQELEDQKDKAMRAANKRFLEATRQ